MKQCLVIRHAAFEDLGTFRTVLVEAGFEVRFRQAGVDPFDAGEWANAALVIVLGGPIGVNNSAGYPFLARKLEMIRLRLAARRPLLGICLGAQLMAAALGVSVHRGRGKEIGWSPVELTEEGLCSPLRFLQSIPVLHWHGDTFDLPKGTRLLASTPLTPHQAFASERALALQFHPEVDAERLETWLIGHACELAQAGIDPRIVRADALKYGAAVREAGQSMLRNWLKGVLSI